MVVNSKLYKVTAAIAQNDVFTEGTNVSETRVDTELSEKIGKTDYATESKAGIVFGKTSYGLSVNTESGLIYVARANSDQLKLGTHAYRPIVPADQHASTFYGLAKAAGDSTQSASSNAIGTYTDEAKTAIRTMLGAVGNADYATASTGGVIKIGSSLEIGSSGFLNFRAVGANEVKAGTTYQRALTPERQHASVFYGLAKAAGDTTQSVSSNAVGTYTPEAKAAIRNMLGVTETIDTVTVSGTDPVITASPNTRYVCGEVSTLSFTPCSTGICDVRFTSGSSVTILTLPQSVQMPEWFEIETNRIYEINIADGVYGGVMSWPITT